LPALSDRPRIAPGSRAQTGAVNASVVRVAGVLAGTREPPNLFATLARHRTLFRPWLRFAGTLMPRGALPRRDTELVILRVAENCGCEYERRHHEPIALRSGVTAAELTRVREGPGAAGWSDRDAALLRAADELHAGRRISDGLWAELRGQRSDVELIELCMLVGHYEMLAMTINALAIQPDELRRRPSALARLAGRRR
jgi:AhpD family alkylhydroperoxidase